MKNNLNHRCKNIALRILKLIEEKGQTLEVAYEIDRRIGLFCCKCPDGKAGKEWDNNEYYLGLIEAKCSLILPMHIMLDTKGGATPEELRKSYPRYETSLPEGWDECLLNLKEVAEIIKPNRFWERERASGIHHWRYA